MHLNDTVLNVIKQNLHSGWVDDYRWKEEFVNVYCTDWFYTATDCFYAIENDATVYSSILFCILSHGREYTNTVDMFNTYIYLYGMYAIEEHPDILEQIREIRRIQKMRISVPLVLNRVLHSDVIPRISDYLGEQY